MFLTQVVFNLYIVNISETSPTYEVNIFPKDIFEYFL